MNAKPSFMGRAVLAILLTIGFYGLALAIVAGLLFLVYLDLQDKNVHWRVVAGALIAAGTILWAILPRPDRFVPPGPRLEPDRHPRLFDLVRNVAQRMSQPIPSEVYLVPDVNAFVSERGGILGIGSKRVMGIGLPLLQSMTISQIRAVLAHEFGHYYSGDTKLAPWVYKTREAIIRTIQGLGEKSWLHLPFRWYGTLFLRVTQAISRQQEYAADEQAARIAGAQPTIEGFRKAPGIAIAFKAFWNTEVVPILRSGFYPQLAEGFSQFLTTRSIADSLVRMSEEIIKRQQANPYDTHPTLRERIAAIEALRVTDYVHDDTPAISLLNDVPAMEQELFTHMFGAASMSELKPIAWQNVGEQVYIPQWQTVTEQYAAALQGVALVSLPEFLHFPNPLTRQVQQSARKSLTKEELDEATTYILGAALSITLLQQGWKLLESMPGQAFSLRKDDSHIEPFTQISNLASGELTVEEWRRKCEQFGISNLMLVS